MDKTRVKYIVDEKNGIVVAEIDGCRHDAIEELNRRFIPNITSGIGVMWDFGNPKFLMKDKYRAVAKCHAEDTWDAEFGKRVACAKLTDVYHRSMNKRLNLFVTKFSRIVGEISDYLSDKKF
jgi:hypothetical protein